MKTFTSKALAGQYLEMGGYIDKDGNLFREKDVLAEDYSTPLLFGGMEYGVEKEVGFRRAQGGYVIRLSLTCGVSVILTDKEYDMSVVDMMGPR